MEAWIWVKFVCECGTSALQKLNHNQIGFDAGLALVKRIIRHTTNGR